MGFPVEVPGSAKVAQVVEQWTENDVPVWYHLFLCPQHHKEFSHFHNEIAEFWGLGQHIVTTNRDYATLKSSVSTREMWSDMWSDFAGFLTA